MESRSFYEVLNVAPNASLETIRAAYHAAILESHPDRGILNEDPARFVAQQTAWETLRDDRLRREYDAALACCATVGRILEDVGINETDGVAFSCRCGGAAPIDPAKDLPQVVSCDGCSLQYRVVTVDAVSAASH